MSVSWDVGYLSGFHVWKWQVFSFLFAGSTVADVH